MKTSLMSRVPARVFAAAVCGGLSLCSLLAQDKPVEPKPAPEPAKPEVDKPKSEKPEAPKPRRPAGPKVAFLGVALGPVDEAIAAQIGLPEGVGVLVRGVMPDSPADKAGVKQHDVLHYFNDQLLVNEPQLTTLVRQAGIGTEVKLTLLRKGKSETLTVKLGEHEAMPSPNHEWRHREMEERERAMRPKYGAPGPPGEGPDRAWVPPHLDREWFGRRLREFQERMKELHGKPEMMREAIERFQRELEEAGRQQVEEGQKKSESAWKKGGEASFGVHLPGLVDIQVSTSGGAHTAAGIVGGGKDSVVIIQHGSTRTTWSDADGSGELVKEDGKTRLTVKDRTGRVIFTGPVDTDDQRKALPSEVRERLERIEKNVRSAGPPAEPAKPADQKEPL